VARVVDDPGAGMDDDILAEDTLFQFTVCDKDDYDGVNCK
jgi:hypothetical protein